MTGAPDIFLSYNREDQAVAGGRKPTSQASAQGQSSPLAHRQEADLRFTDLQADATNVASGDERTLDPGRCYSAMLSPDPPNSAGKSLSFGSPSRIGSTVSE